LNPSHNPRPPNAVVVPPKDIVLNSISANVWYRLDGHRLRWISDTTPRLVYEEVKQLEMAA